MTTREQADPNAEPLADYGKAAIMIPLIIGGAVIVSLIILWHTYTQKLQMAEMARVEEAARQELLGAHEAVRARRPDMALAHSEEAGRLLASLKKEMSSGYTQLHIAALLLEGESLFMKDRMQNAGAAEACFDQALGLMPYASGELWDFGMLGRSRMRFESKRYAEAVADLDTAIKRNPSFGSAYYWRSLAKKALGDAPGAESDERRARALDSWPPLRDILPASATVDARDILAKRRPAAGAHKPESPLGAVLPLPVE